MGHPDQDRIAELGDVELVRMLTVNAKEYAADVLAVAEAEANRRGVPIDEAFIPGQAEEPVTTSRARRFGAAGKRISCTHCGGVLFDTR